MTKKRNTNREREPNGGGGSHRPLPPARPRYENRRAQARVTKELGRRLHQPLSAWARVDVELPFLAEMAMSGPLRRDIVWMPISYANGVVPFGLIFVSPIPVVTFWLK